MKSAEKLRDRMEPGRVYRRQDLAGFSTAVDRDLKALVTAGEVRKLSGGCWRRSESVQFSPVNSVQSA